MNIKTFSLILIIPFVASMVANIWFYDYWYDHEYPSGNDFVDLVTVEFLPYKNYEDNYYVSFNGGYRYILGSGIKEQITNELTHWNNIFNTTNFLIEKPHGNDTKYSFEIHYHTIDEPYECSPGTYKKKVCDGIRLSAWGNWE